MKEIRIRTGIKRMIKVITLIHKEELKSLRKKDIVKQFIRLDNLCIEVTNKKLNHFINEQYNFEGSSIFKYKKLPVSKRFRYVVNPRKKGKKLSRKDAYNAYLNSSKWITLRNKIKQSRGNKCEICSISGVELHGHHLTYVRFGNELESDIQILCKQCHYNVHNSERTHQKLNTVNSNRLNN